jgi:predicted hydrocarbon binding protein
MTGFAMKALPLSAKLKIGLPAMAKVFSQFSDQISRVEDRGDHFLYTIERCPVCWGRHADKPICHAAVGLLQGGVHWVSGGKEFKIRETQCIAVGAPTCSFEILKEPLE